MTIAAVRDAGRRALRATRLYEPARGARSFLRPPEYDRVRLTPRRLYNLYLSRIQHARGDVKLRAYPLVLTIEATNVCNLRCPYCFTGAGEQGRPKSMVDPALYQRLIDELGDRAFLVEFYNWGEPLLNKNIHHMIRAAVDRGASTIISTNLSIPLGQERAREIVSSGLAAMGVSLDGATQESYEKYRVRGDLELALSNVRLINEAKRELRSGTPRMIWEFHVFEHNKHEVAAARRTADELGMSISVDKGWVAGEEWDAHGEFDFWMKPPIARCDFLWQRAIVHNDGGVAPCCGTFYKEDDFASLGAEPAVPLSALRHSTFMSAWNDAAFQDARRMFRARGAASASAKKLVCYDCPTTLMWERYQRHRAAGGTKETFDPGFTNNDGFNYFFNRKPARAQKPPVNVILQD